MRLRCAGVNPDDHRVKSEIVCVKFVSLIKLVFVESMRLQMQIEKASFLVVMLMVVLFSGEAKRLQRQVAAVYGSK